VLVGRTITLDGEPHVVIGVLPASFHYWSGTRPAFFKPLGGPKPYEQGLIGEFDFTAIARLKPGVSLDQARAELNVVQAQIAKEAKEDLDLRAALFPFQDHVVGFARRGLILLLAAVGAVLLIVCVNLANLLLARIPGRKREAAIRTALGATRARLMRQMLTESLLLTLFGGVLGIWLAGFAVQWLLHAAPADLPRLDEIVINARVLFFAIVISAVTGAFFGVLPAWQLATAAPQETLQSGGTSMTENRRTRRLRETLISIEVGLSTLLLILAGLLSASLFHLVRVNLGFAPDGVLAADVALPPQTYTQRAARGNFYDQVLAGIRALPGVRSAGWVHILPLEGEGSVSNLSLPGEQVRPGQQLIVNYRAVSTGYFETMGIPLLKGRFLTQEDRGRKLVLVSQSVAERLWPGKNAVGQECVVEWGDSQRSEIVGVVGDIRTVRLDEPPLPMVYIIADAYGEGAPSSASIVVRTAIEPSAAVASVRRVIQGVDPDVPVLALRPMTQVVSQSVDARRFQMSLASLFAICALLLASLGIFGVVGYSVQQRRQELGIRAALGAQTSDLLGLVLRQGMAPVAVGLVLGIVAALLGGRLIQSLLFGVRAFDLLTLTGVSFVVVLVAAIACYIPARQATRVDPLVALRHE
jgi:predicted permease